MFVVIVYLTCLAEAAICLYAFEKSPHGRRCTWRGLWDQLNYRAPRLPRAVARRRS
jgi:hypothetical protein